MLYSRIPAVDLKRWNEIAETARTQLVPLVVRSAFPTLANSWSLERFAQQWPDLEIEYADDLPLHGVPYREVSEQHQARATLQKFIEQLELGRRCYLNQISIDKFPELEADFDTKPLRLNRLFAINVWIGGYTRSGLHFDNADNLFAQIYGRKWALLISPNQSRFLYPFADNPSKSQVDPEAPNLKTYPAFAKCRIWSARLEPGDALFIPRSWWHFIASDTISVSINCWHGDTLSEAQQIKMFLAGGPRVLWRTATDFVRYGPMHRPPKHRMFSPTSPGVRAYELLRSRFKRSTS